MHGLSWWRSIRIKIMNLKKKKKIGLINFFSERFRIMRAVDANLTVILMAYACSQLNPGHAAGLSCLYRECLCNLPCIRNRIKDKQTCLLWKESNVTGGGGAVSIYLVYFLGCVAHMGHFLQQIPKHGLYFLFSAVVYAKGCQGHRLPLLLVIWEEIGSFHGRKISEKFGKKSQSMPNCIFLKREFCW